MIVEQVANGVSVRMAVLYLLLGGSEPAIGDEREGRGWRSERLAVCGACDPWAVTPPTCCCATA